MSKESFILGLIAGEGTFNVALCYKPERYRYNIKPSPQMAIKMDTRDAEVLEKCREYTGLGSYNEYSNTVYWSVSSKSDKRELVKFVEENATELFRTTNKWESFKKWKRAVEIDGERYNKLSRNELIEMIHIAKTMNITHSTEVTEEEWMERLGDEL